MGDYARGTPGTKLNERGVLHGPSNSGSVRFRIERGQPTKTLQLKILAASLEHEQAAEQESRAPCGLLQVAGGGGDEACIATRILLLVCVACAGSIY